MSDDFKTVEVTFGRTEDAAAQEETIEIVQFLQLATLRFLGDGTDPTRISLLASAAAMFAGTQLGTLIVAGLLPEQHKKRSVDMMAKNIREGIEVGRRRAMRVMHREMGGGNA